MIYNRVLAEMPSPLRRGRYDNPPPNVGVCGFEKRTLFFDDGGRGRGWEGSGLVWYDT